MEKNILAQMLQEYESFTRSERKIVDYILAHKREVQHINIADLSRRCEVSPSTVSLFCHKLKLKGFNDFKLELVRAAATESQDVELRGEGCTEDLMTMRKVLCGMQTELSGVSCKLSEAAIISAVDLLQNAKQVVCLGHGSNSIMALEAWTQFSVISPKFKTIQDSHMQILTLSTLSKADAVLYFSSSEFGKEALAVAQATQIQGAKLILVTEHLDSFIEDYADVLILFRLTKNAYRLRAAAIIVVQLFIIGALT